jgi:hypothetical protein
MQDASSCRAPGRSPRRSSKRSCSGSGAIRRRVPDHLQPAALRAESFRGAGGQGRSRRARGAPEQDRSGTSDALRAEVAHARPGRTPIGRSCGSSGDSPLPARRCTRRRLLVEACEMTRVIFRQNPLAAVVDRALSPGPAISDAEEWHGAVASLAWRGEQVAGTCRMGPTTSRWSTRSCACAESAGCASWTCRLCPA